MVETQTKFEVVDNKSKHLPLKNGVVLILTHQKITSGNREPTYHVCMNKVRYFADGTQNGKGKQLFIGLSDIPSVVKGLTAFYEDIIKK